MTSMSNSFKSRRACDYHSLSSRTRKCGRNLSIKVETDRKKSIADGERGLTAREKFRAAHQSKLPFFLLSVVNLLEDKTTTMIMAGVRKWKHETRPYFLSDQSGGGGYDSQTDDDDKNVNYLLQVTAGFRRVGGGNGSSRECSCRS